MKKTTMFLLIVSVFVYNFLKADPNTPDWNPIDGEVVWYATNEGKIRDAQLADIFHSLKIKGFTINGFHERKDGDIEIQGADLLIEETSTLFRVGFYVQSDVIEGHKALNYAITHYYTSMMPPWFRQYKEGPGNVCFIPIRSDVSQPKTMRTIIFVRDNIAVRVQNMRDGDIISFIKLLDECIITSLKEEDGEVQEKMSVESQPIVTNKPQEINIQNLVVEKKSSLSDDTAPSSVSTEAEKTISLKSFNSIWLYLGIGVILLFAFFYFLRMKRKQRNS